MCFSCILSICPSIHGVSHGNSAAWSCRICAIFGSTEGSGPTSPMRAWPGWLCRWIMVHLWKFKFQNSMWCTRYILVLTWYQILIYIYILYILFIHIYNMYKQIFIYLSIYHYLSIYLYIYKFIYVFIHYSNGYSTRIPWANFPGTSPHIFPPPVAWRSPSSWHLGNLGTAQVPTGRLLSGYLT